MECIAKDLQVVLMLQGAVTLHGEFGTVLRTQWTPRSEYSLSMQCGGGWEVILLVSNDGKVLMQRALFGCVAVTIAAMLKVEAGKAAKIAAAPKVAPRCPHFKSIKRAYAIAREAGLDVKNSDEKMRAAFSRVLGKRIESRETMTGADWETCANLVKAGQLAW